MRLSRTPSTALLAPFAPSANPANFGRIRPISPNLRNPEMRMVNFGIEHQFTKTFKAEVQYIGQFGFGLFGERDANARRYCPIPRILASSSTASTEPSLRRDPYQRKQPYLALQRPAGQRQQVVLQSRSVHRELHVVARHGFR